MLARPFDWRDLPYLHAFREQTLFLDSALVLTRGSLQVLGAMLSTVLPGVGIFTAVAQDERHPRARLIGQIVHRKALPAARFAFLSPEHFVRAEYFTPLLTYLTQQAVAGNVLRLLAELEEEHPAQQTLRKSGFVPYGSQRVWRLSAGRVVPAEKNSPWRMAGREDAPGVQQLYARLASPAMQQVFPSLPRADTGLVYLRDGNVLGYASLQYGLRGVFVRPFLQPELEAAAVRSMLGTLASLSFLRGRPLYVGVTADQGWLESHLADLGAQPSTAQTLLVKHLTTPHLRQTDPLLRTAHAPGPVAL